MYQTIPRSSLLDFMPFISFEITEISGNSTIYLQQNDCQVTVIKPNNSEPKKNSKCTDIRTAMQSQEASLGCENSLAIDFWN